MINLLLSLLWKGCMNRKKGWDTAGDKPMFNLIGGKR